MTEVFRRYGAGEPRPADKAPIACTVRHPDAGGQCEREAIGEVWALPFCEVHGKEAELAYLEERAETVAFGLDILRSGDFDVLQQPVAEALKEVEYPGRIDRDAIEAVAREAYPPEELERHINPDTLAYDYEIVGTDTPYDWWCEARIMVRRFMREAYERGSIELLCDLELIRERATVQQLLARRDLYQRWELPRQEAKEAAKS